jgi:hypothetical protein
MHAVLDDGVLFTNRVSAVFEDNSLAEKATMAVEKELARDDFTPEGDNSDEKNAAVAKHVSPV